MATTTPTGTRIDKPSLPAPPGAPSRGMVSPYRRFASSALSVMVWMERCTSPRASAMAFPSSELMVRASSPARSCMRLAARLSIS